MSQIDRRTVLGILGGALVLSCKRSSDESSVDATTDDDCATIASETSGPYPDLDNMISNAAYERSSIAEDQTGTALTFTLSILDSANACAPIAGALVMVWHCNKDGVYSEYANSMNAGSTTTTFLRGWQTSAADGTVTFTTIYPGWYSPRATHIHVEVYNPDDLTTPVKITQIGFPDDINTAVQSQSTYKSGQTNTTTNDTDQVFGGTVSATGDGDGGGHVHQIASATGDVSSGYTAAIDIAFTGYTA